MKTRWFIVLRAKGRWWVDLEGRTFGPVEDRDEAVSYARMLAEANGDPDRQSQIWVKNEAGPPVLAWSADCPPR